MSWVAIPIDCFWRVSEWLAASLEMKCPVRGCGFDSRALRLKKMPSPINGLGIFFLQGETNLSAYPDVRLLIGNLTINLLP